MQVVLIALGVVGLIALGSFLSGTILYFVWPVAMVEVFHLPALTWWQAVCLTWVCRTLIKSSQSNTNE